MEGGIFFSRLERLQKKERRTEELSLGRGEERFLKRAFLELERWVEKDIWR